MSGMGDGAFTTLIVEDGPWAALVFYLLWRDLQKEVAVREALERNTKVLTEMAVVVRERLGR